MSRKYEIVNVGGLSRVRALRSWVVQGRQVNAGDVGGAVFDERTLSQDGACWIFSGRLDSPLVRVSGDSVVNIVDVNPSRAPFVNIFGTSSLDANAGLSFDIRILSSASPLTPGKMEQGGWSGSAGQPLIKVAATDQIRSTERMFTGGDEKWTVPAPAPGYSIRVVATDVDGIVVYNSGNVSTEVTVPAGAHAYAYITVMKSPLSAIVPADVTAAALTFQSYAEATLNIVDSHITVTSPDTGYAYIAVSGDYQGNVTNIEGSTLQVNRTGGTPMLNLVCDLINTSATVNMGAGSVSVLGVYKNVKNLVWGAFSWVRPLKSRTIIRATDCDNFVMDGANISGVTVEAANTPLVFIRCNMNKAIIVNQPLINNTYIDINFDLATADLGKSIVNGYTMVSSNVNGMYRLRATSEGFIGALVESHESIRDSGIGSQALAATYGTTIYKDAYFNGLFELAGTNVFGSKSPSHPIEQVLNVQPRVVQGTFNTITPGQVITGVVPDATRVSIPTRMRLNRHDGVVVHLPAGLEAKFIAVDPNDNIISASSFVKNEASVPEYARYLFAFIQFRKTKDAPITPEDLAGVTMTVYNGCKISKSSPTSIYMRGNVRVEDNATLYDVKIDGSGYFGGNAVMSGMNVNGYAYMKDNALCTKTSEIVQTFVSLVMEGNAVYNSIASLDLSGLNVFMYDNSKMLGELKSASSVLIMRDNATITAKGDLSGACMGVVTIKDNVVINTSISTIGDITLCSGYVPTSGKMWTGKRVIDNGNEPQYDNNVKTQYDF